MHNKLFFSCCFQNLLFVFIFWQFDYNISLCGFLWVHFFGIIWASWIWMSISFLNFQWLFLWIIFFILSFFSLFSSWAFHNMHIGLLDRSHPLDNPQKFACLICVPILSLPREKLRPVVCVCFFLFHLLALYWTRAPPVASVYSLLQTTIFVLCSPQESSIQGVPHWVLSDRWDKSQSLGNHLEKLRYWIYHLTLPLLRKKLGAGGLMILWHCAGCGDYGERVS